MFNKAGKEYIIKWAMASLAVLLFSASRVLGAYWMQESVNGDYSIVVLMAKRMAQGVEFPLFFYGQAYMGSLEPMLSALFCRMFGFSGFTVCMGTVAFSLGMVPFIYLLGRNLGGWRAGVAGIVLCIIGPTGFFHYTASPRGGYAALLFFTVFLLWVMVELAVREAGGKRCGALSYFATGLAGGISWWVDPLVTPAIIAGSMVYVSVLKLRAFRIPGPYAAAAGFLAGLFPFLIWNHANGWMSFDFVSHAAGSVDFSKGIRLFFARFASLMDMLEKPVLLQAAFALLYGFVFVYFVSIAASSCFRERHGRRALTGAVLVLFVMVFMLCFSSSEMSGIKTPRYLLPLVPAVSVMAGLPAARFTGWRRWLVLVLLAGACAYQAFNIRIFAGMKKLSDEKLNASASLAAFLVDKEVDNIYSRFQEQYLNYFLDERFLFCNSARERYLPYAERMEASKSAAVINGKKEADDFFRSIRAEVKKTSIAGYNLWYGISRPRVLSEPVSPGLIASITDITGRDVREDVLDRCLLSGWSSYSTVERVSELVVTFMEPVSVSGLRLLCRPGHYPYTWGLMGRRSSADEWSLLMDYTEASPYFWSGGRIYNRGAFYRVEGQVEPVVCRQLKIHFPRTREGAGLRVSELQVFSDTEVGLSGEKDFEQLALWLEKKGLVRVYADRWEGNQLAGIFNGEVLRDLSYAGERMNKEGIPLELDRVTALLIRKEDAEWTQTVLRRYGVEMMQQAFGPWLVFYFTEEGWRREYSELDGLVWLGFGAAVESQKHIGLATARMAEFRYNRVGAADDVLSQMRAALEVYPNNRIGVGNMAVWMDSVGRHSEAAVWRETYESMWQPKIAFEAGFGSKIKLLGLDVKKSNVPLGSRLDMKYYWKCEPDESLRNLVVFAHFKRGKQILFQDDRPFLEDSDIAYQPFDEVQVEGRTVTVPYNIGAGDCEVWLGVYDLSIMNKRLKVKTKLPSRKNSVRLPFLLHIKDEQEK